MFVETAVLVHTSYLPKESFLNTYYEARHTTAVVSVAALFINILPESEDGNDYFFEAPPWVLGEKSFERSAVWTCPAASPWAESRPSIENFFAVTLVRAYMLKKQCAVILAICDQQLIYRRT